MDKNKQEKIKDYALKASLHDNLPLTEAVESVAEALGVIANKEIPHLEPRPEIQKVSLEGIEVITLKGDKGDTPSDEELISIIKPLIPEVKNGEDGKTPTKTELLSLIRPLIPEVKDGETPSDERLLDLISPLIPIVENGKDGSPDNGEQIIEKINEAEGQIKQERVDLEAIETKINNLELRPSGGGARGIQLFTDGTKRGIVNSLNLIAGTNVTLTYARAFGRNDLTITASGGGSLSVLAVTGTVNDTNTAFTIASSPTLVIINGAAYRTTGDSITWTYLAGALTLSAPIGTGGSIYALG